MDLDWSHLDVHRLSPATGKAISKPSWGPIERALRELPGAATQASVTLALERDVNDFPTLFAIHDGGGKIGVMFRGDDGELAPAQEHYEIEDVLRIFRLFFDEQRLDPDDDWQPI